jgi:hypothetical protein
MGVPRDRMTARLGVNGILAIRVAQRKVDRGTETRTGNGKHKRLRPNHAKCEAVLDRHHVTCLITNTLNRCS